MIFRYIRYVNAAGFSFMICFFFAFALSPSVRYSI